MRPVRVEVNDKMQKGYVYFRTKPMGRAFRPGFTPELTPKQMFDLGVFGGKYMTDCRKEFPASWFKRAKLLPNRARASLNYFGVNASQPLPEWRSKGWIHPEDPRGWFQWYCRFYLASKAKSRFPSDNERLRISLNACKCSDYGSDLMSSLTKDTHDPPKSPFWIACFNGIGSDGRVQRFKRSTKTTDRKLAQRMADEWEEAAKLAGQGRLTEHHCRRVLSEIYEKAVGEPLHFRSCRAWLTEWLENAKANVTRDTWFRYHTIIHKFLDHIGARQERLLREITPADIRSFRDKLKTEGLSAATINQNLVILRMPFRAAHSLGYVEVNTAAAVKPLKNETGDVSKDTFSL